MGGDAIFESILIYFMIIFLLPPAVLYPFISCYFVDLLGFNYHRYSLLYLFTITKLIGVISPAMDVVVVFVNSLFFLILLIVFSIILLLPPCNLNTKEPLISKP